MNIQPPSLFGLMREEHTLYFCLEWQINKLCVDWWEAAGGLLQTVACPTLTWETGSIFFQCCERIWEGEFVSWRSDIAWYRYDSNITSYRAISHHIKRYDDHVIVIRKNLCLTTAPGCGWRDVEAKLVASLPREPWISSSATKLFSSSAVFPVIIQRTVFVFPFFTLSTSMDTGVEQS